MREADRACGRWSSSFIFFVFLVIFAGCRNEDPVPVDCSLSDLAIHIDSFVNPTSCTNPDGSVTVAATGGKGPYQYALNDGSFGTSATFTKLTAGEVIVTVSDGNGCEQATSIILGDLQAIVESTSSGCSDNKAMMTISPSGGQAPYQYSLDGGVFQDAPVFSEIAAGKHTVGLRDQGGCKITVKATVTTGVSFENDIQPLLRTFCIKSGCHNGDNGNQRNWNNFSEVEGHADMIRDFTSSRSMPPVGEAQLSDDQIQLIACWVDDGAPNN